MSIKKFNTISQQWELITPTKVEHDIHVAKKASATELGHIKIDTTTIAIDSEGKISVIGAPDATTLAKGIVQLSSAINLNDETMASTPKAVKDALAEAKTFTEAQIANLIGSAPETLDTFQEIAEAIQSTDGALEGLLTVVGTKADKTALEATDENVTALTQTVTSNKTAIEGALASHVADNEAHITQAERQAWNEGSNLFVGSLAPANTNLLWVTVVE
ncbi:phage tail protein [Lysinibacillus sp. M3]|uniref:Phage tail protein n=1 Tax=Lysinibacillus zambalensis TaxID=3160866 RepID=A0ABV1MVN8_9BACI